MLLPLVLLVRWGARIPFHYCQIDTSARYIFNKLISFRWQSVLLACLLGWLVIHGLIDTPPPALPWLGTTTDWLINCLLLSGLLLPTHMSDTIT